MVLFLAGAASGPAFAEERSALFPEYGSFRVENDFFGGAGNHDRHYTNGIQLSTLSGNLAVSGREDASSVGAVVKEVLTYLPGNDPGNDKVLRLGLAFGQSLFTPDDTKTFAPLENQRPYAGWTYLAFSAHGTYTDSADLSHLDVVQIQLGIVGPHAFGEEVQNGFHDELGQANAAGWANQLHDEPGLNLVLERTWRRKILHLWNDPAPVDVDTLPHLTLSVGNVHTFIAGGGMIRFGKGLDRDFGPPRIFPGLHGSESFVAHKPFAMYAFVGAEGRFVGRNIFLDGNTFRDSLSVNKRPLVGEIHAGIAMFVGAFRIAITQAVLTPEFHEQKRFDQFGSFSATAHF